MFHWDTLFCCLVVCLQHRSCLSLIDNVLPIRLRVPHDDDICVVINLILDLRYDGVLSILWPSDQVRRLVLNQLRGVESPLHMHADRWPLILMLSHAHKVRHPWRVLVIQTPLRVSLRDGVLPDPYLLLSLVLLGAFLQGVPQIGEH